MQEACFTNLLHDPMLLVLEEAFEELHKKGGRPPRLSVLDKLVVTSGYYRECRTMQHIGFDYGVSKSRISDAVKWVKNTLSAKPESFQSCLTPANMVEEK